MLSKLTSWSSTLQSTFLSQITEAEFCFSIYDCDGTNKIDAYDIADVLRSLNCNPTLDLCEKLGATKKRGEKKLTVDEFLPIYEQVSIDLLHWFILYHLVNKSETDLSFNYA